MKIDHLFKTWGATMGIAKWVIISNVGLVGIVFSLALKIVSEHERIVLVPAVLNERAQVNWSEASGNYMEAWGLFVASMIGSITPQTALSVADAMGYYFDAKLYPSIRTQILSIVDDPNYSKTGTLNVFTPKRVYWEASTEKVFVEGTLMTTAYKNNSTPIAQLSVTYEMIIKQVAGLPKIMRFNSYVGQPRTLKWINGNKHIVEAEEKSKAKLQDSILPQDAQTRLGLEEAAAKAAMAGEPTTAKSADGAEAVRNAAGVDAKKTQEESGSNFPIITEAADRPTATAVPRKEKP